MNLNDSRLIIELRKRDELASKKQDFVTLKSIIRDEAIVMAPGKDFMYGRKMLDNPASLFSKSLVGKDIPINALPSRN